MPCSNSPTALLCCMWGSKKWVKRKEFEACIRSKLII